MKKFPMGIRKHHFLSLKSTIKRLIFLTLCSFMTTQFSFAQVRPDINSFTSAERTQLVNAMMQYITPQVLESHCNYDPDQDDIPMIHSDFDFLPFHRLYIQGMEDYLISLGPTYYKFVPLPKWNPGGCTPTEFRVVDPDCASATCNNGDGPCSSSINWCPNQPLPNYLSLPVQAGGNNDLCDWPMNPTAPIPGIDVCCPSGLSYNIENPYHNPVHGAMSGVMGNFRSPAAPIFWLWHAYVDDIWKTWEKNCTQSTTKPVDLWMADNRKLITSDRDRGEEPDIDNGPMWISEDIWVRNQQDGFTNQVHEDPIASPGTPVYVYIRVRNRGYSSSLGTEKIQLRWAKAATSLSWPANWDGSTYLNPPTNTASAGNIIATQAITTPIDGGGQQIIEIAWYPPNPSDYNSINTEPWHFCLLARIIDPNDPMPLEGSDLNANVKQYNNIVWKNINVIDNIPGIIAGGSNCPPDIMQGIGEAVAVGNPFNQATAFDIDFSAPKEELGTQPIGPRMTTEDVFGQTRAITTPAATPEPANPITQNGNVIIALDNQLYEKWVQGGKKGNGFTEIQPHSNIVANTIALTPIHDLLFTPHRKLFEITSTSASFENITLQSNETHTTSLMVLYPINPISGKQEFKYDIMQKRADNGTIIGGVRYNIKKPDCSTKAVVAGNDRNINLGCSTTLTADPQLDCAEYAWSDQNGNVISRKPSVTVTPVTTTNYTLKTIAAEGCVSTDNVTVNVTNQVCTQKGCLANVQVSPNPVLGATLNVAVTTQESVNVKITFAAVVTGNIITQLIRLNVPGENLFPIDVSGISKGSYRVTVQCINGDGTISRTVTVL